MKFEIIRKLGYRIQLKHDRHVVGCGLPTMCIKKPYLENIFSGPFVHFVREKSAAILEKTINSFTHQRENRERGIAAAFDPRIAGLVFARIGGPTLVRSS
uniref:Uncharacterized protein n=1 Tax=Opuntia streptacantha TaxID=393608 RepID=A0A7C9D7T0_OPUST